MNFINLALILFTLFTLLFIASKWMLNIFKLKYIKHPVRSLTDLEKTYLMPYVNHYPLTLRDNNVYSITGGGVSFHMIRVQGNTLTRLKFEGINVLFPYGMTAFMQDESNTLEFVVAKATVGEYIALVVSVNGIKLLDITELFWGAGQGNDRADLALNVLRKRSETQEEKAFRLRQLWFGASASALICALLLTAFALYVPLSFNMVSLVISALLVLVGLYAMLRVFYKRRNPQPVLKVKGRLVELAHHPLNKVFDIEQALYFTPDSHVKLMHDELKRTFLHSDYDKDTEYTADITADKRSGYQLLSLSPFPSLASGTTVFAHYKKQMKAYVWSGVIWVGIALAAFLCILPYSQHIPFIPLYLSQDHLTLQDLINEDPPIGSAIKIKDNAPFVCQTVEIEREKIFDCNVLILGFKDAKATFFLDFIHEIRSVEGDAFYYARRNADDVDAFDREIIDSQLNAANKVCQSSRYFDCEGLYNILNSIPKIDKLNFRQRRDGGVEFVDTPKSIGLGEMQAFIQKIARWARYSMVNYVEDYIGDVDYSNELSTTEQVILQLPEQLIFYADAHAVTNERVLRSNSERFDTTDANALINGMQIAATDFSTMPSYIITGKVFRVGEQAGVRSIKLLYKSESNVFIQSIAILLLFAIMLIAVIFVIVRYVYIKKALNSSPKIDTI